ncbi:MAG: hypothetical protein EAZ09_08780 [Oscillatoriales cyanobacterium]|nr:MAG: hypothetical protein EAZ18_07685 [Oscillatoriales cyanobacterium]TAH23109.1 MAG: hypothetical protein EAZ09_08780 [Oscillatoriales cyanobacterium]
MLYRKSDLFYKTSHFFQDFLIQVWLILDCFSYGSAIITYLPKSQVNFCKQNLEWLLNELSKKCNEKLQ